MPPRARVLDDLPPTVADLDPPVLAALEEAVAAAHRGQAAGLLQARDDALRVLPFPLRVVFKKVIG